jgi:hypothetical protein
MEEATTNKCQLQKEAIKSENTLKHCRIMRISNLLRGSFTLVTTAALAWFHLGQDEDRHRTLRGGMVDPKTEIQKQVIGYIRPPVIYGHIHMAKTAGTELNGIFALKFERICGHKGYSYDAIQANLRFKNSASHDINEQVDAVSKLHPLHNRGRVHKLFMDEIGYEDCDYISLEEDWTSWNDFRHLGAPLELHVPCRDPIDHLMSQCNFWKREFDCNNRDYAAEVDKCLLFIDRRYSKQLEKSKQVKCFDYRFSFTKYLDYMSEKLQRRRIEAEYYHRETNQPRQKENECIWKKPPGFRRAIERYLIQKYDYYDFCQRCMGSSNDLLAASSRE